jgi:hypothetical protein
MYQQLVVNYSLDETLDNSAVVFVLSENDYSIVLEIVPTEFE